LPVWHRQVEPRAQIPRCVGWIGDETVKSDRSAEVLHHFGLGDLWHQKTRVFGVSCGVVCVILCLAVLVKLRLVTDGRTDTDRHRPASTADA